ncbi:MAG: DNA-3-methyladenine glycosylase I [Fidelibacterota bacterium]|nr:MAG: DNA-3-methyladenine glycosylase I [Candidatus Neomarinimicrobiota bacterium]
MEAYHDTEWGVPVHDDRTLFEFLLLDHFQAGLSWRTILHKRENFRRAFDNFDPRRIADYNDADRKRLLADQGIIRNVAKVNAAVTNAAAFLRVQEEFGSFDRYIWRFTDYRTLRSAGYGTWEEVPVSSPASDAMSRDLKTRGFKFVGTVTCYAYMQSIGMVNDHLRNCFLYARIRS